jgi:hypothetical protein
MGNSTSEFGWASSLSGVPVTAANIRIVAFVASTAEIGLDSVRHAP